MAKTFAPLLLLLSVLALLGGVGVWVWVNKKAPPPTALTQSDPVEAARNLSAQMQDLLNNKGDLTFILPDTKKLATENPTCFEAQLLLGQLYVFQKRMDLAYSPIHLALTLRPINQELTKLLGALALNTDRPQEAEQLYRQALKDARRSRERGKVYAMLGVVLQAQNKLDEADQAYAKAIEDDAFLILAHIARADLALKQNRLSDAIARMEDAQTWADADPSSDQTQLNLLKQRILEEQNQQQKK